MFPRWQNPDTQKDAFRKATSFSQKIDKGSTFAPCLSFKFCRFLLTGHANSTSVLRRHGDPRGGHCKGRQKEEHCIKCSATKKKMETRGIEPLTFRKSQIRCRTARCKANALPLRHDPTCSAVRSQLKHIETITSISTLAPPSTMQKF